MKPNCMQSLLFDPDANAREQKRENPHELDPQKIKKPKKELERKEYKHRTWTEELRAQGHPALAQLVAMTWRSNACSRAWKRDLGSSAIDRWSQLFRNAAVHQRAVAVACDQRVQAIQSFARMHPNRLPVLLEANVAIEVVLKISCLCKSYKIDESVPEAPSDLQVRRQVNEIILSGEAFGIQKLLQLRSCH